MTHLISVDQFDKLGISRLFKLAHALENEQLEVNVTSRRVSANLFYEPSTRTSSSFYAAMVKLGGSVIPINDVTFSSVSKGETLEDTIRVMSAYVDVIVLRHPEVGAAQRAAAVTHVPIINAGDGIGEHPTQALLDLYTIQKHHDLNLKLNVALVGDLKHGRTVHSLLKLLRLYDVQVHLVSPPQLQMPHNLIQPGDQVHHSLTDCINHMDVVYVTRVQKERFDQHLDVNVDAYRVTPSLMAQAAPHMTLMHPLPRVDEISPHVDADPRARYFEQCANGMWIRQAIFVNLLGRDPVCWKPITLS